MSIFVNDDILYFLNKPVFKYLETVHIRSKDIISVLDGNIKAKYKGKIVKGLLNSQPVNGWYKVQLIKII